MERDCARIIELEGQPDSTSRSTMIVPFVLLVGGFLIIDSGILLCYSRALCLSLFHDIYSFEFYSFLYLLLFFFFIIE